MRGVLFIGRDNKRNFFFCNPEFHHHLLDVVGIVFVSDHFQLNFHLKFLQYMLYKNDNDIFLVFHNFVSFMMKEGGVEGGGRIRRTDLFSWFSWFLVLLHVLVPVQTVIRFQGDVNIGQITFIENLKIIDNNINIYNTRTNDRLNMC